MSQQNLHSRRRVSKACDSCRSKKIKCNGEQTCSNCLKYGCPCTYTHTIKKRKPASTRVSNRKLLDNLSSRLSTLENLLIGITDKIVGKEGLSPSSAYSSRDNKSVGEVEADYEGSDEPYEVESDEDSDCTDGDSDCDCELKTVNSDSLSNLSPTPSSSKACNTNSLSPPCTDTSLDEYPDTNISFLHCHIQENKTENYIGAHTSFSIFSKKGLRWLRHNLEGKSEPILPLLKLNAALKNNNTICLNKFFDTVQTSAMCDFPSWEVCESLWKVFMERVLPNKPITTTEECIEVLEKLRTNKEMLTLSESMLLSSIFLLAGAFEKYREDGTSVDWGPVENNMLLKTVYFYQQIFIKPVDDPIKCIQAVFFLCVYMEASPVPQSIYMILATAIRLAQDIGLHRRENLLGLEPKELRRHLTTWWFCYKYDRYITLRAGKPSLIHEKDVTTFSEIDFYYISASLLQGEPFDMTKIIELHHPVNWYDKLHSNTMELTKTLGGLDFVLNYHSHKLYQLSGKAYTHLFSSGVAMCDDSKRRHYWLRKLMGLLDEWENCLPPLLKPTEDLQALFDLPEQIAALPLGDTARSPGITTSSVHSRILALHLEYYLNIMSMSRFVVVSPWKPKPASTDHDSSLPRNFTPAEKCLYASRKILQLTEHIMLHIDDELLYSEVLCTYFSAFLTLLCVSLEAPESSRDDLLLMTNATHALVHIVEQNKTLEMLKCSVIAFATMHFLKLAIEKYNSYRDQSQEALNIASLIPRLKSLRRDSVDKSEYVAASIHPIDGASAAFSRNDDLSKTPSVDEFVSPLEPGDWLGLGNDPNQLLSDLLAKDDPIRDFFPQNDGTGSEGSTTRLDSDILENEDFDFGGYFLADPTFNMPNSFQF